jgi:hypothetical protein
MGATETLSWKLDRLAPAAQLTDPKEIAISGIHFHEDGGLFGPPELL